MKKIKSFIFSEKKLSSAIFGVLILVAFAFIFGPNIYAQFARQTGGSGLGYGHGYGYGYGYGFDGGTYAGHRIDGGNLDQYGYGYGHGYLASDVEYSSNISHQISSELITTLIQSGTITPASGSTPELTTSVTFNDQVSLTNLTGATIIIGPGVTMTADSGSFDIGSLTAGTGDIAGLSSVVPGFNSLGQLNFGLPDLGLTLSSAISINIPIYGYEGRLLNVYSKTYGGTWTSLASCTVTGNVCTFNTTHLSDFSAGYVSSSSGGGGGGSPVAVVPCTSVVYGDFSPACFAGYQYRNVTSKTPANCSLTPAQQEATRKVCGSESVIVTDPAFETPGNNYAEFIALEKSLVKNVNKALTKRLAGRILLQVEGHGEAWYVNPVDGLRYFMGRPADAFALMRSAGLGINESDFANFNKNGVARLDGRILLRVKSHGEAYYVNPLNHKLYYMGRPADAFALMRNLGLGINNTNLHQIAVGQTK